MSANPKNGDSADDKVAVTLPETVEKIIPSIGPNHPEKAQIAVQGAEDLYREIRVENTLQDDDGNPVSLKLGAEMEVTIAPDSDAIKPKEASEAKDSAQPRPLEKGKHAN